MPSRCDSIGDRRGLTWWSGIASRPNLTYRNPRSLQLLLYGTGSQPADARIADASGSLGLEGQIIGKALSTVLEIMRDIHPQPVPYILPVHAGTATPPLPATHRKGEFRQ